MRLAHSSVRSSLAALLAVALGFVPRLARAQEATPSPPAPPASLPAPSPPPAPPAPPFAASVPAPQTHRLTEEEREAAYKRADAQETQPSGLAFRADFRLPFTVSTLYTGGTGASTTSSNPFAPVPQLTLGLQYGRFGFGLGLGFFSLASTAPNNNNFGGPSSPTTLAITELMIAPTLTCDVFQSNDHKVALYMLGAPIFGDIIVTNESSLTDLGFQFALGANVALHENFHVGLEAGPVGHFYSGGSTSDTLSTVSVYTALVGTFVYPR